MNLKEIKILIEQELVGFVKNLKLVIFLLIYIVVTIYLLKIGKSLELIVQFILNKDNLIPFTFVIPYYSMVIVIPIVAIFLGYNSISGIRKNKSLRNLFTKVGRSSYLISKFISISLVLILLSLGTMIWTLIYTFDKLNKFLLADTLFAWLIMCLFGIAFLSITLFFSSINKSPTFTLSLSLFSYFILSGMMLIKQIKSLSIFTYVSNGIKLSSINNWLVFFTIAVLLVYIIIPFIASITLLNKQDE